jgi:hypothetical protein
MMLWYRPETPTDLRALIRNLPDDMAVASTGDTGLTARTVGELRELNAWPQGLVILPPRFVDRPESTLKIERVN